MCALIGETEGLDAASGPASGETRHRTPEWLHRRLFGGEWSAREDPTQDKAIIARSLAALFLAGATGSVIWLLLPHTAESDDAGVWAATIGAYVVGAILIVGYDRLPVWALKAAVTMATVVITAAMISNHENGSSYVLYYFWATVYAFAFFSLRQAALQTLLVGIGVRDRADQRARRLELGGRALAAGDRNDDRRRGADPAADGDAPPALAVRARGAPARRTRPSARHARSPTCSSAACCRRRCPRSRASSSAPPTGPTARASTWAGTSTTSSSSPGGDWGLIIGDVRGKGPEAATVTSLVRHTVRAAAVRVSSPGAVLNTVNSVMLRDSADEELCTAIYGRLESRSPVRMRLSIGGHPQPVLLRADGSAAPVGTIGTLLGVHDESQALGLRDRPRARATRW